MLNGDFNSVSNFMCYYIIFSPGEEISNLEIRIMISNLETRF
jgi:hypothetical protein